MKLSFGRSIHFILYSKFNYRPPPKVFLGNNHRILPSRVVPNEISITLRKRVYSTFSNSQPIQDDINRYLKLINNFKVQISKQ